MSEDNKSEKSITRVKENPDNYIIEERFEMIEGVRYDFLSSPKINHQILVSELTTAINHTCQTEGLILFAPLDVHFDEANILQPDIIFIQKENLHIIKDGYIKGVPDLLNNSGFLNTGSSILTMPWLISFFSLMLAATYDSAGKIESPQLACLSVELDKMFKAANQFDG